MLWSWIIRNIKIKITNSSFNVTHKQTYYLHRVSSLLKMASRLDHIPTSIFLTLKFETPQEITSLFFREEKFNDNFPPQKM